MAFFVCRLIFTDLFIITFIFGKTKWYKWTLRVSSLIFAVLYCLRYFYWLLYLGTISLLLLLLLLLFSWAKGSTSIHTNFNNNNNNKKKELLVFYGVWDFYLLANKQSRDLPMSCYSKEINKPTLWNGINLFKNANNQIAWIIGQQKRDVAFFRIRNAKK